MVSLGMEPSSHPYADKWLKPKNQRPTLHIYNSLTRTKVPFHPVQGNNIRWYNCGPTVYDASHIGHARNYITFDILRRILEDYFGYDVSLIMNITDIDDKIIIRARQEHLVREFRQKHTVITGELRERLQSVLKEYLKANLNTKSWEELAKKQQVSTGDESDAKVHMHIRIVLEAKESLERAKDGEESDKLLDAFNDVLAADLDARHGASVTDQKIFRDLAAFWEMEFLKDMQALNMRPVSLMTRVTEFVPQVIECVERIIKNGYGYVSEGSVYFDVDAFSKEDVSTNGNGRHLYAKLCPWSAGNCKFIKEGEGSLGVQLGGKRDPRDFALWKASKAGEPSWDSPWGPGRPGWHIECSAMAAAVAPGTLDIHSGGIDLAFPHHDNELAQSEAFYESQQWVNYFLHAGHVHIEGHKMSKSLKNFITIREALERYTARQMRIMFLQHQWDSPVFYKESSMTTAIAVETLFSNFLCTAAALLNQAGPAPACPMGTKEIELLDLLGKTRDAVHSALCDNFDTPQVLLRLQELVNRTNVYLNGCTTGGNMQVLKMIAKYVHRMLSTFGVVSKNEDDLSMTLSSESQGEQSWNVLGPILKLVSAYRDSIRQSVLEEEGKWFYIQVQSLMFSWEEDTLTRGYATYQVGRLGRHF